MLVIYTTLEFIIDFEREDKAVFAEKLGVSKQQLNSWLNQTRPIPKKWLEVLSKKYQLNEKVFSMSINKEIEVKLYGHLLKLFGDTSEVAERKVNYVETSDGRIESHFKNLETLQNLLIAIQQREATKHEGHKDVVERVIQKEIEFIERIGNYLSLFENDKEDLLQAIDKILDKK